MDSTNSVDRPQLDDLRTMSYNRVTVPTDLKNTICSQIADSTDSLPLWNQGEYDGAHDDPDGLAKGPPPQKVVDSSNIDTPKLERGNPMESLSLDQQKTAQPDELEQGSSSAAGGSASGAHGDKDDRPGTLRRLTTKIKKTMSSGNNHHGEKKAPSPKPLRS